MIAPEPFFDSRGTPFSVYYRSKALQQLGHKIDIITYHLGKTIDIEGVTINRIPKIPFIRNVAIGPSVMKIFLDIFLFFRALFFLIKKNYDCIHAHEESAFLGAILKKIFGIPLTYDMHSRIPEQLINFNFFKYRPIIKLANIAEKWIIENSDVVITICQYLEDSVHKIDPNTKAIKIENIPLPLNYNSISTEEKINRLKERFGIENNKIILYTGTLVPYQGLSLLLESIPHVKKMHRDVKFVIVGGEPKNILKLKDLSARLNIEDSVIFTGKQPIESIAALMAMADVLTSPRIIGTNVPMKIYTYLRSGKPIVATNITANTQVLSEKIAILTEANEKSFAKGLIRLLDDKDLGEKLGMEGKKFVEAQYTYSKFLSSTKQVYDHIARIKG